MGSCERCKAHGFVRLGRGRKLKAVGCRPVSDDKAHQYRNKSLTVHFT